MSKKCPFDVRGKRRMTRLVLAVRKAIVAYRGPTMQKKTLLHSCVETV